MLASDLAVQKCIQAAIETSEATEQVKGFIDLNIGEHLDSGNPEIIESLIAIRKLLTTNPKILELLVTSSIAKAEREFLNKDICPECGGKLTLKRADYGTWDCICSACEFAV